MQTQTESVKQPEPQTLVNGTVKFGDSRYFKALMKLLDNLTTDEVCFELYEEGIRLTEMDPSRVSMTILDIHKYATEEFLCVTPGLFCVNIDHVVTKVLKNVYPKETVELEIRDAWMHVTLQQKLTRHFKVLLLDPTENEIPPTPKNIVHTARAKFVVNDLETAFKDISQGAHVEITATNEKIEFTEIDEGAIGYSVPFKRGCDSLLDIETKRADPIKSNYSANYLKEMFKALKPVCEVVDLEYAKDMPLRLSAQMPLDTLLHLWLAPRIEAE